MNLTDKQKEEAERVFLMSKLEEYDLAIVSEIDRVEEMLGRFKDQKVELQNECKHPLIARDIKNRGYSGHWDGDSAYWADHVCSICYRRWSTTQRWEYVGTKLGLPEDAEAKNWDS